MTLVREGRLDNSISKLERQKVFMLGHEVWLQEDDYVEFLNLKQPEYRLYEAGDPTPYHLFIAGAHEAVQVERYFARWRKYLPS